MLNALCGRAYYGKTTGKVSVNGNDSKIENHKSCIGFVPQEDIVFADLTVKENLVSSTLVHRLLCDHFSFSREYILVICWKTIPAEGHA